MPSPAASLPADPSATKYSDIMLITEIMTKVIKLQNYLKICVDDPEENVNGNFFFKSHINLTS